jgi:hypothetical protein
MRRPWTGLALALLGVAACTNAGEKLTVPALPNGAVQVFTFFDRDDTHSFSPLDTVFAGARVALLAPGGNDTLRVAVSDAQGLVTFDTLPVGTYRVVVDRHALGDSIGIVAGDTGTFRVTAVSFHIGRLVRFGYAEVSLASARALPVGQRVLLRSVVTSPLQAFSDSNAFLVDSSGSLRITGSRPRVGAGNNVGDSVLVVGTTAISLGQHVIADGLFVGTITNGIAPLPKIVSIDDAATAQGGALDAALVQITSFVIRDTVTTGPNFSVTIASPSDSTVTTTVRIDQLLLLPHSAFSPGRTGLVRGVLMPDGDGAWVLRPRNALDFVLN